MSDIAIRVENLSKRYHIGRAKERHDTLRDALTAGLSHTLSRFRRNGRPAQAEDTIWALKDVSFEVRQGEIVGVIGRNGAGKSTLLKILSRITEPTTGRVTLNGRVGSLLEVGTGFHPELTGRENIYLNGAILGMQRAEIDRKFDEIVAFSEIEKFLDTPVKRYSSGMYVRLAFSVAAHLDPEILLVDEVLAVGDIAFQKKCLGKMDHISKQGRTVLFVSHNMQAISSLTPKCILLNNGNIQNFDKTSVVMSSYIGTSVSEKIYEGPSSTSEPKITRIEIMTSYSNNVHNFGERFDIYFNIDTPVKVQQANLSFQIVNSFGIPIVHLLTLDSELPMLRIPGKYKVHCCIPKLRLYVGQYSITAHLGGRIEGEKYQTIEGVCHFEVKAYHQSRDHYWKPGSCTYVEDCDWYVEKFL